MTISVTFKNMESSEHLKQYAVKRFEKLSRFCSHFEPVDIQITMLLDNKVRHKAEVHVVGKGLNISALEESADMYASIDMVLDKIEAQIKKLAEKQKDRRRSAAPRPVAPPVIPTATDWGTACVIDIVVETTLGLIGSLFD